MNMHMFHPLGILPVISLQNERRSNERPDTRFEMVSDCEVL